MSSKVIKYDYGSDGQEGFCKNLVFADIYKKDFPY